MVNSILDLEAEIIEFMISYLDIPEYNFNNNNLELSYTNNTNIKIIICSYSIEEEFFYFSTDMKTLRTLPKFNIERYLELQNRATKDNFKIRYYHH